MKTEVIRRPAVAGFYYPLDAGQLRADIEMRIPSSMDKTPFKAVLVPYSPYQRCGDVAAELWARTQIPKRCIIVGPSLTGSWMPWSLLISGAYRTPLGDVPVDTELASAIAQACPFVETDAWGQVGEHAVEVQLPFMQVMGPADLSCVPLSIGSPNKEQHRKLAEGLARVIQAQSEPVLLVASADLSQFEPETVVRAKDAALLDALCAVDADLFQRIVQDQSVQMPSFPAVNVVLQAARLLGSTQGECFAYQTNVDAGGDSHSAVGYAGFGWTA